MTSGQLPDRHTVRWGDYDNDGDQDFVITVGGRASTGNVPMELYSNDRRLRFVDVAEETGVSDGLARGSSVSWADLGFRINALGYKVVVVPEALFYHLAKNVPAGLKPSRRTLRRMTHMHRNRFVAYYRSMHTAEFLLALPVLLLGSPLKPFTFIMSLGRKLAYAAAIVPVTWYAFAQAALIHFPRHAEKGRSILQRRRQEPFWLLKQIIRRKSYNE
jgi:hypothetical protein